MSRPDVSATRKPQILAAAIKVLRDKGLEAARMEEIAHAAGLSVGGVYWYYQSKDALVAELVAQQLDTERDQFERCIAGELHTGERLRTLFVARAHAAQQLGALQGELYAYAVRNAALRARIAQHADLQRATIAAIVQQAIERDEMRVLDAATVVATVGLLLDGLWRQFIGDGDAVQPTPIGQHALAALMLFMSAPVSAHAAAEIVAPVATPAGPQVRRTWKGGR